MGELHDVVITGEGVICAAGRGRDRLSRYLDAGQSALHPLPPALDDPAFLCRRAGTVPDEVMAQACADVGVVGRDDRSVKLALLAAHDALASAGLLGDADACASCSSIIGTGVGALSPMLEAASGLAARGVRGVRPTAIPRAMPSTAASVVSIRFGLHGASRTVSAACASSTMAMGEAFRLIRHGEVARVLCGGTDGLAEKLCYAAWNNMRVLAGDCAEEERCRPFDVDSEGLVLGEGAGMFVLESAESASRRGAPVLGRIVGYGESSDARHMTQPDPAGQGLALVGALANAGVNLDQVGAILAHGTGTNASDAAESASLAHWLGDRVAEVPVVSTKPVTGHTLGASGAIETVVALGWLAAGRVTPNISFRTARDGCSLCIPTAAVPLTGPLVVNPAFAFGGANAVLLLGGA
jgi:3-oxoacyl-(acyl-carrier-protein) synthase